MSGRDELANLIASVTIDTKSGDVLRVHPDGETPVFEGDQRTADALLAAGYRKVDHAEYAADHRFSDLEFTDEDGDLWTDREDFEEYFKEYGGCKLVQRHVTAWEPLA